MPYLQLVKNSYTHDINWGAAIQQKKGIAKNII